MKIPWNDGMFDEMKKQVEKELAQKKEKLKEVNNMELNFVSTIKELEQEKRTKEWEHKQNMEELTIAIEKLRELNTVCERCEGAKGSFYRMIAEADKEWHKCVVCNGTGKSK